MNTTGRIIDSTTYKAGISNMEPGASWDRVFVARYAGKVKDPQLLCVVLSMPEWYALVAEYAQLQTQRDSLIKEHDKLLEKLYDARALMYQTREALHKGAKHITKTMNTTIRNE